MTQDLSPAEREASARAEILGAFDQFCPNIVGNPFIPQFPTPQQAIFLGLHLQKRESEKVFEALYGGAAGGGKSSALLMALAQYAWRNRDFAALAFRRTLTELEQPGALLDRAKEWWIPAGVKYNAQKHSFQFPSGAKVQFAYLEHSSDHMRYQGAEYQLVAWDELTQWENDAAYKYVSLSRIRRNITSRVPLRALATANPGGPGHAWVRERFVDPATRSGRFVPAKIDDNRHVDRASYIAGLQHLHPTLREQLLLGDWEAREPGDYFRREWFGPLLDPATDIWPSSDCVRVRWWDLAASEKESAARTAGVRMARHRSGVRAIEHCVAFRLNPGARDARIIETARLDGPGVTVGIEIEPGSGGIAQFMALERQLKAAGHRVVGARPGVERGETEELLIQRSASGMAGKAGRAAPVASCLERGYQRRGECPQSSAPWWGLDAERPVRAQRDGIRLFAGAWTQAYLDVIESFPNGATCDEVDATSGAWAWLEARGGGSRGALPFPEEQTKYAGKDLRDVNPDHRPTTPRDDGSGLARGTRWTP